MTQQTSPFLEGKYGWDLGESGWNFGADDNWLKFSYLFDRNLDGIVASLPPVVNATAYYNTTDNRVYYAVGGIYYSSPVPKWFEFVLRTTGEVYVYNGTSFVLTDSSINSNVRLSSAETSIDELLSDNLTILPRHYGILTVEQGATSPVAELAKWETMRLAAEALKANVYIPAGTYELPQGVRLDADNTTWTFSPGSVLKLWDTQATDDFILISSPLNQTIRGLRFDANRAMQNSVTFGIDNCGVIIVDASNFTMEETYIVSSPAKGLAVVSSAAGTNSNVTIRGVRGGDCNNQAVLFDGNNMTGFFEKCVLDDVQIGTTSHAGVAINDGVHNLQVSNVKCDVNNVIWDAVFVRDSWDIQLTNVRGRRGRNGVQIQSLNTICRRIQMDNVIGDNSDNSGVLILACEDITAGTVTGFNNNFAGINIAQTGGGVRCKNISIANPSCYDDRGGGALQDYGLHIAGCDGGGFGEGAYRGNTVRNVRINRTVSTDIRVPVIQRLSITTGSVSASSVATVTIPWTLAFEDVEYDVSLTLEQASASLGLEIHHLSGQTASQITVVVRNAAAGALTGTVHAVARRRY